MAGTDTATATVTQPDYSELSLSDGSRTIADTPQEMASAADALAAADPELAEQAAAIKGQAASDPAAAFEGLSAATLQYNAGKQGFDAEQLAAVNADIATLRDGDGVVAAARALRSGATAESLGINEDTAALLKNKEHLYGRGTRAAVAADAQQRIEAGETLEPVEAATMEIPTSEAVATLEASTAYNTRRLTGEQLQAAGELLKKHGGAEAAEIMGNATYDANKHGDYIERVARATEAFQAHHGELGRPDREMGPNTRAALIERATAAETEGAAVRPEAEVTPGPLVTTETQVGIDALTEVSMSLSQDNAGALQAYVALEATPDGGLPTNMNEVVNGMMYEMGVDTSQSSWYRDRGSSPLTNVTKREIADLVTSNSERFPGAAAESEAGVIGPKTVAAIATIWNEQRIADKLKYTDSYMRS